MNYKIQKIEDLPLVVVSFDEDFGEKAEMIAYTNELRELYDQLTTPVYQIADTSNLSLDFDALLSFVQIAVRGENNVMRHPNNLDILVVTTSRFYQMAAKGLNTATFGHVKLMIFDSVEAAMNYVREQIKRQDATS